MNILEILDEIEKTYPQDIFPDITESQRNNVLARYPRFIDCQSAMMGRHLARIIREKITADMEWRAKYESRLIAHGCTRQDAHETAEGADNPDNDDPEGAADSELSYQRN